MKHTYLLTTQEWLAQGDYFDENDRRFHLTAISKIVRNKKEWTLTGFMDVAFEKPARFYNDYNIKEPEGNENIAWESYNPAFGKLIGHFIISGDTITSDYVSEDGKCSGYETLRQIDEQTYENKGNCNVDGKKISSWEVTLKAKNE